MKYVITGSLGNISKPLIISLIAAKHQVLVITSKDSKKAEIEALGATAAVGSIENVDFLTKTFHGADAVYTMVPPNFATSAWKKYIAGIGQNYATAIKTAGVKKVVNLSSIGAHMPDGCGPVSGLFYVEETLNGLSGVDVKHLRPGFFYTNFLANIGMVKHMNIIGNNYSASTKLTMVAPIDIAEVAAEELLSLSFTGKSVRYILSDIRPASDVAAVLGKSVGKADLPWIEFKDADSLAGMMQNGVPEEIAKNYVEMGTAVRSGAMMEDYYKNPLATLSKTKLEDFAPIFAQIYNS